MGSLPSKPGVRMVAIDPGQPRQVFAAGDTGLFRSDDAGQTWQAISRGLPPAAPSSLALDPRQLRRLYVALRDGCLYGSEDGGGSWQALPGPGASGG